MSAHLLITTSPRAWHSGKMYVVVHVKLYLPKSETHHVQMMFIMFLHTNRIKSEGINFCTICTCLWAFILEVCVCESYCLCCVSDLMGVQPRTLTVLFPNDPKLPALWLTANTPSAPLALMPPPPSNTTPVNSVGRLQMKLHLHGLQQNATDLRKQLSQLRRMQVSIATFCF